MGGERPWEPLIATEANEEAPAISPDGEWIAYTSDETAKQRFLQEAKAASALDHPNICNIHEINETDDGQLYLVMASYDGETLKERIARGPLKVDDALDIATQELADRATKKSGHTGRHWVYKDANPSY